MSVSSSQVSLQNANVLVMITFVSEIKWCETPSFTERIRRQPAEIAIGALKRRVLGSHWFSIPLMRNKTNVARGLRCILAEIQFKYI